MRHGSGPCITSACFADASTLTVLCPTQRSSRLRDLDPCPISIRKPTWSACSLQPKAWRHTKGHPCTARWPVSASSSSTRQASVVANWYVLPWGTTRRLLESSTCGGRSSTSHASCPCRLTPRWNSIDISRLVGGSVHPVTGTCRCWFTIMGHGFRATGPGFGHLLKKVIRAAGIRTSQGRAPRIHDLRFTFAVQALLRWYRAGVDVQARLPALATYLGHASVVSTQYYLTFLEATAEAASERFHTHSAAWLAAGAGEGGRP